MPRLLPAAASCLALFWALPAAAARHQGTIDQPGWVVALFLGGCLAIGFALVLLCKHFFGDMSWAAPSRGSGTPMETSFDSDGSSWGADTSSGVDASGSWDSGGSDSSSGGSSD